jgi:hypothetical protein
VILALYTVLYIESLLYHYNQYSFTCKSFCVSISAHTYRTSGRPWISTTSGLEYISNTVRLALFNADDSAALRPRNIYICNDRLFATSSTSLIPPSTLVVDLARDAHGVHLPSRSRGPRSRALKSSDSGLRLRAIRHYLQLNGNSVTTASIPRHVSSETPKRKRIIHTHENTHTMETPAITFQRDVPFLDRQVPLFALVISESG